MKKLRMKLEDLSVETFDVTEQERARRGTVHANATRWCTDWATCASLCSCPTAYCGQGCTAECGY